MRIRTLIVGAIIGLVLGLQPELIGATTDTTSLDCKAWIADSGRSAQGSCGSPVATPWRLAATMTCAGKSHRIHTEYSIASPKQLNTPCRWRNPAIERPPSQAAATQ